MLCAVLWLDELMIRTRSWVASMNLMWTDFDGNWELGDMDGTMSFSLFWGGGGDAYVYVVCIVGHGDGHGLEKRGKEEGYSPIKFHGISLMSRRLYAICSMYIEYFIQKKRRKPFPPSLSHSLSLLSFASPLGREDQDEDDDIRTKSKDTHTFIYNGQVCLICAGAGFSIHDFVSYFYTVCVCVCIDRDTDIFILDTKD